MTSFKIGIGGCHKRGNRRIKEVLKIMKGIMMALLYQAMTKTIDMAIAIDPIVAANQIK